MPDSAVEYRDEFAGPQSHHPAKTIGDFIIWTKRGQPSYQLAVVVDDHRQGITHIVRGDDLLDSAARQLLLYRALDLAPEPVAHPRLGSPCTPGALVGRGAARRDRRESRHAGTRVEPRRPRQARVDHEPHPGNGQRRLGDVGREHDATTTGRGWRKRDVLLGQ